MSETGSAGPRARLRESETAALLGQSGFRRLYAATTVSTVGDALYFVAVTWLAYDLTGSTAFVGLAVALTRLPAIASVLIGPLVDRAPLGRLLPAVEVAQAVVVTVVPVAHAAGVLSVWLVLGVVTVVATLQRVSNPATQAALPRVVEKRHLARANSVATASRQAVSALAEAASGALIAVAGAVVLFALDVVTFAVSATLLLALRVPPADADRGTDRAAADRDDEPESATPEETDDEHGRPAADADESGTSTGLPTLSEYLADIREGVATIRESVVLHALVGATLASVGTGLATAVLPAFGDGLGGADAYGLLVGAATTGTLVGSGVATRFQDRSLGTVVVGGFLLAAVGRVVAAVSETPLLVFVAFGLAAVPVGVYNVLVSTVVQVGVPDDLLARVSSTNGTLLAIVGPLGLLAGGAIGTILPSAAVVGLSAGGYLLIAGYWLVTPRLRSFGPVSEIEDGAFDPA